MSTIYVGIDPDTKASGVAVLDNGYWSLRSARAFGKLAKDRFPGMADSLVDALPELHDAVVAIEWQHMRYYEKNPNAMMGVQAVAGMALAAVVSHGALPSRILLPRPSEWKGTIAKEIHQRRILKSLNCTIDSDIFAHIPRSLRQHVVDAMGLALWAREQS